MVCRHCGQGRATRPRGLCWTCYYTPGLRDRYPSTSKYGQRGLADFNGRTAMPAAPTRALPGTPEKIAVLQQRALMRQSLWHPDDAPATCDRPRLVVA
jgi:hypothetical protein